MVLEAKRSTVAYRCPSCGCGVMSVVDTFGLGADMIRLKCDCKQSEMTITKYGKDKVRFTVPCMLCPKPHSFTVSTALLFAKELFVLPCPYSDINIAMMGDSERVKAELARTELELLDLLEKSGIESFEVLRGEEELPDPQVVEIIAYMIKELDEEGRVVCKCPEGVEGSYEIEFLPEGIRITCQNCGATKLIETSSLIQAYEFINTDLLELE